MELGPTTSDVGLHLLSKIRDLMAKYRKTHAESPNQIRIIVGKKETTFKDQLFGMDIDYEISDSRM